MTGVEGRELIYFGRSGEKGVNTKKGGVEKERIERAERVRKTEWIRF